WLEGFTVSGGCNATGDYGTPTAPLLCDGGTTTVTYTITDTCEPTTIESTFTISAPEALVITTEATNIDIECDGSGNNGAIEDWLNNNGNATVSDNCLVVTWTNNYGGETSDCADPIEVIFTATDACGNSVSTSAFYSIIDTIAPEVTPASPETVECDGNGNIDALNAWLDNNGGATATDDCSAVAWSNDFTGLSDECGETGSATVTFTATDACGNESSTTATFTIQDTIAPMAPAPPADITYECESDVPAAIELTATDNCSGDIIGVVSEITDSSDACNLTITRTWTFTDACNNTSSVSQIITVADTVAPVAPQAPADLTVECITELPANIDLTATDNCAADIVASPVDSIDETIPCNIIVTRTWTFTDTCNNTSSVSQIITVVDTTAPEAPIAPAAIAYQCIDEVPAAEELIATDNCAGDIIGVVSETTDDADACNITITRTWTFTDNCDNSSSVSQIITVADTTAPTMTTVAADQTVLCDGTGNAQEFQAWLDTHAGSQATDNCSAITWSHEILNVIEQCGETTRTLVRFIATDACNNSSSTTALFSILDLVPPTIETEATDLIVECDGLGNTTDLNTWLTNNGGATATDLCGNVTWTNNFTELSDGCGETGSATVTFTATDDCDNSVTTTATFTIEDTIAPIAPMAPADVAYDCIADVPAAEELTATDNCSGDITGVVTENIEDADSCNITITRTWTFTDACNNMSSVSQIITVSDTIAPIAPQAPADITYQCEADVPAAMELTATDNCAGDIIGVVSETTDNSDACNITITRTWTFTDTCNNTSSVSQVITVADTTAPVAPQAPADIAYQCIDDVPAAMELTATDNCAGDIIGVVSETTDNTDACNLTITRTWTFTDTCNNSTSISQTITVADTIAPVISTESSDISIECDGSGNNGAIEAWLANNGGAVASDNCSEITWTNNYGGTTSDCADPIEVIFTATDACGNSTSTTATYLIQDTIAPEISPATSETVECDGNGNIDDLNTWLANNGGATATDDCSAIAWSNDFTELSDECGETGSATVTFTATDGCGNTSSVSATFTIIDTIAPTAPEAPADIAYECVSEVPVAEELTAMDNCAGEIVGVLEETTNDTDSCNIT
ncbi:hypothetical protein OS188_14650, partial [Xanthomarina sp. F1114]|uniref:HYR-like domain-containing protein n=1 Tax=Xanthomarina sp. F1114 TaxID=2996019 RepID=UPI00225E2320